MAAGSFVNTTAIAGYTSMNIVTAVGQALEQSAMQTSVTTCASAPPFVLAIPLYLQSVPVQSAYTVACRRVLSSAPL
jgi:hypothetical protein